MIEYFKLAYRNIKKRALRSWLTILGIIIGVFLVVSLLSLSEGLNKAVMGELQAVGSNIVMVMPGEGGYDMTALIGGQELGNTEMEAIRRARGVDVALEMPWQIKTVRWRQSSESALLWALDLQTGTDVARTDMGWDVREGDFARPGRREVMVGHLVPRNIFPGLEVGDEITVSGRKFTVSGILRSLGNREDDNSIIFDLPDYRSVTDTTEGTPIALVRVLDGYDIDLAVANIERALDETMVRRRGDDSPSYSVMTSEAMIEMVESILGIIQAGIIAFASIAILVGAIGIMNTMFTSVRERTKEIGILKAVGAKRKHINKLFLIESGMIGLLGGLLGTALGMGFARLGEWAIAQNPDVLFTIEAHFSLNMILTTLLFSFLLGCISGYLPAKKAAKLNPVDALMYE